MKSPEFHQVEVTIEEAKEAVKQGDALDRLLNNPDFQEIIVRGYLREHAIDLVSLKAAPGSQTADKQSDILRSMDAIGYLQQYLYMLQRKAEAMVKTLADAEEARMEMLTEGNQ
jgi:hypothetical protein